MDRQKLLRDHVVNLVKGGGAHLDFEAAVGDLPPADRGRKPDGMPHTPWRLVEHMRIAQWDILEFCRNPDHESPPFPEGYWPQGDAPPDDAAWDRSVERFLADRAAMSKLVSDSGVDLLAPIPHGDGQTILREALLVADHNAYHLGQLIAVRRALGVWRE